MVVAFPFNWEAWASRCSSSATSAAAYKDKQLQSNDCLCSTQKLQILAYIVSCKNCIPKLSKTSHLPTFNVSSDFEPFCSSFAQADTTKSAIEYVLSHLLSNMIARYTDGKHWAECDHQHGTCDTHFEQVMIVFHARHRRKVSLNRYKLLITKMHALSKMSEMQNRHQHGLVICKLEAIRVTVVAAEQTAQQREASTCE